MSFIGRLRLLTVTVSLKNVGTVTISPGKKGCRVEIRELRLDLVPYQVAQWTYAQTVLEELDILRPYQKNAGYSKYETKPGAAYPEFLGLIVRQDTLLMIKTTFWSKHDDDAITDYCISERAPSKPMRPPNWAMQWTSRTASSSFATCAPARP